MALTQANLTACKTHMNANATALPFINTGNYAAVAALYNVLATPNWTAWKSSVAIVDIGRNTNGAELGGLTTANHTRLQTIIQISGGFINPSLADQRAFFDDVFSGAGGAVTRASLLVLWKRLTTLAEKVCSTGTGSDASPATLTFEGALSFADVERILVQG